MIAPRTRPLDPRMTASRSLAGKRGLVVGIANAESIATGCARAFAAEGAEIAATYMNAKALPHVRAVTDPLGCAILAPCDVTVPGELEAVFARIAADWGRLDFLLHAIAFAPAADLHGRVVDCSAEGFALAMDVSCHSFLRMARLAAPLMTGGGCLLTLSFDGANRVVPDYGLMGPVKAALECAMRYAAAELGPLGIRAHAISPGPIATRAAGGIAHFDAMLADAAAATPGAEEMDADQVGALAAFLVGDSARSMTGCVIVADNGRHIMA